MKFKSRKTEIVLPNSRLLCFSLKPSLVFFFFSVRNECQWYPVYCLVKSHIQSVYNLRWSSPPFYLSECQEEKSPVKSSCTFPSVMGQCLGLTAWLGQCNSMIHLSVFQDASVPHFTKSLNNPNNTYCCSLTITWTYPRTQIKHGDG